MRKGGSGGGVSVSFTPGNTGSVVSPNSIERMRVVFKNTGSRRWSMSSFSILFPWLMGDVCARLASILNGALHDLVQR
jgi:hypothetical protein